MSDSGSTDARVRFSLSEDGMKLGVSRYFPPEGKGRPLTAKSVREQLKAAGLTQEPEPGAPERIITLLRQKKSLKSVVLVRGEEPREPADAEIVPVGDIRFPAFPGQIVAKKLPPSQGEPGRTIDGRIVPPKTTTTETKRDLAVQSGENCFFDQTQNTFTAQVYGMVVIREDAVHVVPGLEITEDLTKVLGIIHFRDVTGQAINPHRFKDELSRLDVAIDVDEEAVREAVKRAQTERKLQKDVPVVSGKEPMDGADGWLEYLIETHAGQAAGKAPGTGTPGEGKEGEDGEPLRIDYRDRGVLPTADPGAIIAKLHEPEPGNAGLDIYGRPIPSHSGKKLSVLPGENVVAIEDGLYKSKNTGLVVLERGVLSVTQLLMVRGDVDISVGHIRAELGSVRVTGTVQTGMEVEAPKHIIVDQVVEGATLTAGEHISVGGGILMDDKGLVKAKGDVTASFANSAIIEAGGNVEISTNITNSHITAGDSVYAIKGKGLVQGGVITARQNIEAMEIGTDMGVDTTIVIDIPTGIKPEVASAKQKIKRELRHIEEKIGKGDPREILTRTKPEHRKAVAEIIKRGMAMRKKLTLIDKTMKAMMEKRQQAMAEARIKVWKSVHPGTTIKIGGRVLSVQRRYDRSMIYWNQDERRIVIGRLGRLEKANPKKLKKKRLN